jgi:hypothetical protein
MLDQFATGNKWTLPTERDVQAAMRVGLKLSDMTPPGFDCSTKTTARLLVCSVSTVRRDVKGARAEAAE